MHTCSGPTLIEAMYFASLEKATAMVPFPSPWYRVFTGTLQQREGEATSTNRDA